MSRGKREAFTGSMNWAFWWLAALRLASEHGGPLPCLPFHSPARQVISRQAPVTSRTLSHHFEDAFVADGAVVRERWLGPVAGAAPPPVRVHGHAQLLEVRAQGRAGRREHALRFRPTGGWIKGRVRGLGGV